MRETAAEPGGKAESSGRARLSGPERRDHIAGATLSLIARRGLHGTTLPRIASWLALSSHPNALNRLQAKSR